MNAIDSFLAAQAFISIGIFVLLSILLVHVRDVLAVLKRTQEEMREVRYFFMIEYKKSNKKEEK